MNGNSYERQRDDMEMEEQKDNGNNGKNRLESGENNGSRKSRGRSKSPRPVQDGWKNPSGSIKDGDREPRSDSVHSDSNDPPSRRQSDDAYEKIRESLYKKDPRRASEPANKPRYPPPPKLETYPTQPRSFLWLAMLTAIVNIVFGIIALVCAITSDNAWAAGDRKLAKKRGHYALGTCIVGILCTAIIIIAVPVSYKYMYPT